jgi:hypothetical protein
MIQPKHHQSTGLEWPYWFKIYGAKYYGVPHMVKVYFDLSIILDNPKSVNLIYPFLSNNIFYGLRLIYNINYYSR